MTVNINGEHFGSMREMIEKAQADPEWARQHGVHIGTVHKGETFVEKQVISGGKVHESK